MDLSLKNQLYLKVYAQKNKQIAFGYTVINDHIRLLAA